MPFNKSHSWPWERYSAKIPANSSRVVAFLTLTLRTWVEFEHVGCAEWRWVLRWAFHLVVIGSPAWRKGDQRWHPCGHLSGDLAKPWQTCNDDRMCTGTFHPGRRWERGRLQPVATSVELWADSTIIQPINQPSVLGFASFRGQPRWPVFSA